MIMENTCATTLPCKISWLNTNTLFLVVDKKNLSLIENKKTENGEMFRSITLDFLIKVTYVNCNGRHFDHLL